MSEARPKLRYSVRAAEPTDRAAILELLAEHRGGDAAARYAWFYEGCPHGPALTWIAVADETKRPIGLTSIFPRRMWLGDREVKGCFGGDSYVRPEARRMGVGQRLLAAYGEHLPELGLAVMFGLPQPANRTPLGKLDTFDLAGGVARYVRPLTGRAALALALTARVLGPLHRGRLDAAVTDDPRVDEIWRSARASLGVCVVRDAAYYAWRFSRSLSGVQRPHIVMDGARPVAACALERDKKTLYVADLVAAPADVPMALATIARSVDGIDRVELRYMPAYGRRGRLWRAGYFARSHKPVNILVPPGMPGRDVFRDGARWFVTWADSDMDQTELA
jgi:GNAT superfamily N-acetyltransferase